MADWLEPSGLVGRMRGGGFGCDPYPLRRRDGYVVSVSQGVFLIPNRTIPYRKRLKIHKVNFFTLVVALRIAKNASEFSKSPKPEICVRLQD